MYAVIATGGKQYRVEEGDSLRVERLDAEEGAEIELDRVLLVGDGDQVTIGRPFVEAGKVAATVKGHGRSRKIKVVKFKRRKNYLRRHGHRQSYTELEIRSITADQLAADQPAADQLAADQPAADQLAADQLAADQPAADQLAADQLAADQLAADQPAADQLAADQPAADQPAADQPAAD